MPGLGCGAGEKRDGVQLIETADSAHPDPRTDATTTGVVREGGEWHLSKHDAVIAYKVSTGKKKNELRVLDVLRSCVGTGI